jgi:hypothetical protein
MKRVWDTVSELQHQGNTVVIRTARGETLANGWTEFHVASNDQSFTNVFGEDEVRIVIKPSLPYSPENDLDYDKRTPEQTILIKEISDIIRQLYF